MLLQFRLRIVNQLFEFFDLGPDLALCHRGLRAGQTFRLACKPVAIALNTAIQAVYLIAELAGITLECACCAVSDSHKLAFRFSDSFLKRR